MTQRPKSEAPDGPEVPEAPEPPHGAEAPQRGDEERARADLVEAMRALDALGLNRGSTGNASLRWARGGRPGLLITPTGATAERLRPSDLCWMGDDGSCEGPWEPSSEWGLHRATYAARPDLGAVLHTHAEHATALACLGRPLPAFHYMVAVAGGVDVPLVPYHRFGSQALADGVAAALADRQACLLAQHGLVSAGRTLGDALKIMREVESLCRTYLLALAVGNPPNLDADEMACVLEKFRFYGQTRCAG
jgi:L-fuculose-phosphate aldolase